MKDEFFHDTTPNGPPKKNDNPMAVPNAAVKEESKPAYTIVATIDEPGLGLFNWWNQQ